MTVVELKTVADKGDPQAQFELGERFHLGKGVLQDSITAVDWWQKAAAQKFPPAELSLGIAYGTGDGVPKSEQKGVEALSSRLRILVGREAQENSWGCFILLAMPELATRIIRGPSVGSNPLPIKTGLQHNTIWPHAIEMERERLTNSPEAIILVSTCGKQWIGQFTICAWPLLLR